MEADALLRGALDGLPPAGAGVGIDCEDVERWRALLPRLLQGPQRRLFTEREHAECRSRADPAPHYAARWCAKEAVAKALSSRVRLTLSEIEIESGADGAPRVVLHRPGCAALASAVRVSLAHSERLAVAIAIVDSAGPSATPG